MGTPNSCTQIVSNIQPQAFYKPQAFYQPNQHGMIYSHQQVAQIPDFGQGHQDYEDEEYEYED